MAGLTDPERALLAEGFAQAWAADLDDPEDAAFVVTDPAALEVADHYADMIAPTVEKIIEGRL